MKIDFKSPSVQGFLIALVLAVLVMWFYLSVIDQKNYFVLDNPNDSHLEIVIDGESWVLAPFETVHLDLEKGKHTLTLDKSGSLDETLDFEVKDEVRGLLNPTLSDYVIYKRYYGKGVNKDSLFQSHQSLVDSTLYIGELYTTDSVYIKGFYLNVDQSYPKLSKSMDTISGIWKIFRKENFKKFYKDNFQ